MGDDIRPAVLAVDTDSYATFEKECNELIAASYEMQSCHCATVNDGEYDSRDCWKAVFIDSLIANKWR